MMIMPYIIDIVSLITSQLWNVIFLPCLAFGIVICILDIIRRLIQI